MKSAEEDAMAFFGCKLLGANGSKTHGSECLRDCVTNSPAASPVVWGCERLTALLFVRETEATGPGTPTARWNALLDALEERFPGAAQHKSSRAPEPRYLEDIDALKKERDAVLRSEPRKALEKIIGRTKVVDSRMASWDTLAGTLDMIRVDALEALLPPPGGARSGEGTMCGPGQVVEESRNGANATKPSSGFHPISGDARAPVPAPDKSGRTSPCDSSTQPEIGTRLTGEVPADERRQGPPGPSPAPTTPSAAEGVGPEESVARYFADLLICPLQICKGPAKMMIRCHICGTVHHPRFTAEEALAAYRAQRE